jgi:hypothetical protein
MVEAIEDLSNDVVRNKIFLNCLTVSGQLDWGLVADKYLKIFNESIKKPHNAN